MSSFNVPDNIFKEIKLKRKFNGKTYSFLAIMKTKTNPIIVKLRKLQSGTSAFRTVKYKGYYVLYSAPKKKK